MQGVKIVFRYIGTYLIIFTIFAGGLVLIVGVETFFRFGLGYISCIFASFITATILVKKEFEFKGVLKEILVFLFISAFLLILTHINYELSFISKNTTMKKLYIQIYYLIDFIAYFIFSYISFIFTKRLIDDGMIKKIALGILMFILIIISFNYTVKKMQLIRDFELKSQAILLYKDGVGIRKVKSQSGPNYKHTNCTEVTLEVRKPLYKLRFNEEPKAVSELEGIATIKYSYGNNSFQEDIELRNANLKKSKMLITIIIYQSLYIIWK